MKLQDFAADVADQVGEGVNPAYALVMLEYNWDLFKKAADNYRASWRVLSQREIMGSNTGPLKNLPYSSLCNNAELDRNIVLKRARAFFVAVATICKTMNTKTPKAKYARKLDNDQPCIELFDYLRVAVLDAPPKPSICWNAAAWGEATYTVAALFGEVLRTLAALEIKTKEVIEFE